MKLSGRAEKKKVARTELNQSKKSMALAGIIVITIMLIVWVFVLARKSEQTVKVVMLADDVYKNQVITDELLTEYDMQKTEFEKYAVKKDDGTQSRRILLWSEKDKIIGSFAAYPLQKDTVAMYDNFIVSRIDNSDSVLYSFPGKTILKINIATEDLESYKTFLEPGDRVNITAIYKDSTQVESADGTSDEVETIRTDSDSLRDIMVADLINADGESILDIYESYNDMTVYEQAEKDADESFKESVTPTALLVAFTPEEMDTYYKLSNMDAEFEMSLPQRE